MNETMKENLLNQVETIEKRARREALQEAANIIWEKCLQIDTILDSEEATRIFENCYGDKFNQMYALRRSQRSKYYMLMDIWSRIIA